MILHRKKYLFIKVSWSIKYSLFTCCHLPEWWWVISVNIFIPPPTFSPTSISFPSPFLSFYWQIHYHSSSFPSARSLDLFLIVFTPSYMILALKPELRQKKLNSLLSSLGCTRNTQHQLVFFHHPVSFSVKALNMWLVQANQRIFLHLQ